MYTHAVGCFVRDTAEPFSPFAGDDFWTHCIGYEGWRWELFGGGIYLFERLYREVRARRETEIVKVVKHPYGKQTLELLTGRKDPVENPTDLTNGTLQMLLKSNSASLLSSTRPVSGCS